MKTFNSRRSFLARFPLALALLVFAAARADALTMNLDFDVAGGPTQAGFLSMERPNSDGNFTQNQTFADVFGPGLDATVSFNGDRARLRNEVTGTFSGQSDLLRDWYGTEAAGAGGTGVMSLALTLPAGDYNILTYHHDSGVSGVTREATLIITDATGTTNHGTLAISSGTSPSAISTFSTSLVSNGLNPIMFNYTNLTGQFVLNGFELELLPPPPIIPEPTSLLLLGFGGVGMLLAAGRNRRRRSA